MKFLEILKNIFSISDIDCHYVIKILGVKIKFKHDYKYQCPVVKCSGVSDVKRNPELIVSLTSFPARINSVEKTIRTLLTQTMKPDRVILWLADEQFPNGEAELPISLINLKNFGLEIAFCHDIRSYKKLIPTLKKYPDAIIVTTDDDIYYAPDTIETLYKSYTEYPTCIHAHRVNQVKLIGKSMLKKVKYKYSDKPSYFNRLIGYGAVLYPPHSLYKDIVNEDIFMNILPTHDDIWFWSMAVLNHTKIRNVKGEKESIIYVENTQQHGLCKINKSGLNKVRIGFPIEEAYQRIIKEYPMLIDILKENSVEK